MGTKTSEKKTETSEKKKYIKVFLSEEDHETFKMYCTRAKKPMQELLEDLVKKEMQEQFYLKDQNGKTGKDGESTSFATITQNTVFAQIFEQLEKINQRLDAVENKNATSVPTEKTTSTKQNNDEESDRLDAEAVDNNSMNDGNKNDIAANHTNSDTSADNQTTQPIKNSKYHIDSNKSNNSEKNNSEKKKRKKEKINNPEASKIIKAGEELSQAALSRRLGIVESTVFRYSQEQTWSDYCKKNDPHGVVWKLEVRPYIDYKKREAIKKIFIAENDSCQIEKDILPLNGE
ncbi:MAG: hypothetical protein QNJ68_07950 [Microcoleaceae cyanobacterium MO_207.B10]|nr:hypothetical protein [Microcoleaceae cyanobacterium MO_207.B10]